MAQHVSVVEQGRAEGWLRVTAILYILAARCSYQFRPFSPSRFSFSFSSLIRLLVTGTYIHAIR